MMQSTIENNPTTLSGDALTAFEPTGRRARFLDQRMRANLADSLRYILQQANGQLAVSVEAMQQFLGQLEREPVSPLVFSLYCDAVLAIEEDDLAQASRLLADIMHFGVHAGAGDPLLIDLANPASDTAAQRIVRFIDSDPTAPLEVFSPSREASETCRRLIREAFDLMDAGDPEQAAEIRGLLREIVLAAGTLNPKAMTFDGASSYMLWGGIIINANQRDSALVMAQMLVHEASHNFLFGLCVEEALVENPDDELFSSPLRKDPRPMDGIYHATFVTARMHRVIKRLLDSGTLSEPLREKARKELAENARLFANGIDTVRRHGRLTALGKAVMHGATEYMAAEA